MAETPVPPDTRDESSSGTLKRTHTPPTINSASDSSPAVDQHLAKQPRTDYSPPPFPEDLDEDIVAAKDSIPPPHVEIPVNLAADEDVVLPPFPHHPPEPFPAAELEEFDDPPPEIGHEPEDDIILSGDSDSDEAQVMSVGLDEIPTLAAAYEEGTLKGVQAGEESLKSHDAGLNGRVSIWRGDITTLNVDAIVNAANSSLLGGGGVDRAIHRAAGTGLVDECRTLNGAKTGEAKITAGHKLPAKHVIHTVGPIYKRSKKEACEVQLRSCYRESLKRAVENELTSVAFSGVSTGIYGYPLGDATHVALDETRSFLSSEEGASIERVIFTVFRQIDVDSYSDIAPQYFPPRPASVIQDAKTGGAAAAETEEAAPAASATSGPAVEDNEDTAGNRGEEEKVQE